MAYADHSTSSTKTTTLIAVAALHAAGIYALVTGLSFVGVIKADVFMPTKSYPADRPSPTPPPPDTPKAKPQDDSRVTVVPPVRGVEVNDNVITIDTTPYEPSGTVIELPTGSATVIDPLPAPRFTPKFAAPLGNPGTWVTPNDYPASELRAEHQGVTRFRVTVGSNGRVADCQIVGSSGWPVLDAVACQKIAARARFAPATDSGGEAVVGSFTSNIRWVIPE